MSKKLIKFTPKLFLVILFIFFNGCEFADNGAPDNGAPEVEDTKYSVLGFWYDKDIVFEILEKFENEGIRSYHVGGLSTVVYVDSDKFREARKIIESETTWKSSEIEAQK